MKAKPSTFYITSFPAHDTTPALFDAGARALGLSKAELLGVYTRLLADELLAGDELTPLERQNITRLLSGARAADEIKPLPHPAVTAYRRLMRLRARARGGE